MYFSLMNAHAWSTPVLTQMGLLGALLLSSTFFKQLSKED